MPQGITLNLTNVIDKHFNDEYSVHLHIPYFRNNTIQIYFIPTSRLHLWNVDKCDREESIAPRHPSGSSTCCQFVNNGDGLDKHIGAILGKMVRSNGFLLDHTEI
jgi:hypothetical protein